MHRFVGYRPAPPEQYYAQGAANAPDVPQYEGVVFTDGTVVCRWLTAYRSHSVWTCWDHFYRIHGHPEYGTRIDWIDGEPAQPPPADTPEEADNA
jgi:hypothetical protein